MAVAPGGDEDFLAPVHVEAVVFGILEGLVAQVTASLLEIDVVGGVHDVQFAGQAGEGELTVVEDTAFALLTGLGGDEHDTVTGLGAVNGGGGGVLQDLHGLDHFRIQILDVFHLQTVHDEERSDVTGVGGVTADADVSALARSTGRTDDLDTGGLTLEGDGGVGGGTVLEVIGPDGSDGTGEVALLLDTVTDHDGLVKELGVLLEDHIENGLVSDGNHLGGVTDAGNFNVRARGHVKTESTVNIGHRADGRVSDNHHGGTDDRCTGGIGNRSADGTILGGRDRSQEARCDDHRGGRHSCKKLPCHKALIRVGIKNK